MTENKEIVAVAIPQAKTESKEEEKETTPAMENKAPPMKHVMLSLTILCFILSLPILFSIIWLLYMRQYDCEDFLRLPKLQVGIVVGLIFVFFVSNVVVYLRSRFPMPGLICVMVPLIFMVTIGFVLVGAYKMESQAIPGSPMWIKMEVHDSNHWNNIKSCLYYTRTCKELVSRSYILKAYDFTTMKFSFVQSGCCKPPASCEMEYVNATFWTKVGDGSSGEGNSEPYNSDCDIWQNQETTLCYNCHSCKHGFATTIQGKWWKLGVFLVVMSVLLIVSHMLLFVATMWERYAK